jgi:hypothetical protein
LKTAPAPILSAIRTGHVNTVGVVVYAEWNHNSMYRTFVDNEPAEYVAGSDTELFPIESITQNNRPEKSGICKAVAGQAYAESSYHRTPNPQRFYAASADDVYKYWQSPTPSDASKNITQVSPYVMYMEDEDSGGFPVRRTVKTNKINLCVENSFSNPTNFEVQIMTGTGSDWVKIADQTTFTFPSTGRVALWYNGTAWTTTRNTDNIIDAFAVRLVVTKMSTAVSYFNLIEMGFGLELDVSADVSNVSPSSSMGEPDFITPLGTASSNTGSITLFNDSRKYTNENTGSILYHLLDKGVKFTGYYRYENSYNIQDFVLYSDNWDESESETVVSLVDYTRFFQETKPPRVLYEDIPVQEAIWRLCDVVGFNSYVIDVIDEDPSSLINIFWTDADKTVWQTLQELSRATQTAIFFDSYGQLRVKTRAAAFNKNQTPVDTLTRDGDPTHLPNIVNLSSSKQYEANKVKITYKPTKFSSRNYYVIPYEQVWAPEDVVTLRASRLLVNMTSTSNTVTIAQDHAETWPYKGKFQIEGEWIVYEGKEYSYDLAGVATKTTVMSLEEQKRLDDKTAPERIHLNQYTGKLFITERGSNNTEAQAHTVRPAGWATRRIINSGTAKVSSGAVHNAAESSITITNAGNGDDYMMYTRGSMVDEGFYYLGTSIRIDKSSHAMKRGGIFFNADGGWGTGYFVEITASSTITGKLRDSNNEIVLYSQNANGVKKVFGGEKYNLPPTGIDLVGPYTTSPARKSVDIGAARAVTMGQWVDLDVVYQPGTNDTILVYVNGSLALTAVIPSGSGFKHARNGAWGLYARGASKVSFDYAYAIENPAVATPSTTAQYWDRITQGFRSNQWMVDWVYSSRMVKRSAKSSAKVRQLYDQRFFDEFGPILHEIRDFDVKFSSEQPVIQSKLYLSNNSQCVPLGYSANNGGAKFTLANTSRDHAVLSGEDDLSAEGEGTINQMLFIYGRPVLLSDEQTVERQDDWSIRRRGVIETDYTSPWIQSEAEAERFADWLTTHFRTSDTVLTVEIFGNPLYELGDLVQVNNLELSGTYYVVEISNTFESGLVTNLTLRKT